MNQDIIVTAVEAQFDREVDFLQRLVRAKSNNPFLLETSSADTSVVGPLPRSRCSLRLSLRHRFSLSFLALCRLLPFICVAFSRLCAATRRW
jgi:hypothetical protein